MAALTKKERGQKIRATRLRLGLSPVEFAKALGYRGKESSLKVQTRRFELGLRDMDERTWRLFLMYDAYGVPKGWIK